MEKHIKKMENTIIQIEKMIIMNDLYYGDGEFEFVKNTFNKSFLKSAHKSISICKLWEWLRFIKSSDNKSFIWSSTPEIEQFKQELQKDLVNVIQFDSSHCIMMRQIEFIAKNGYEKFKNTYLHIYKLNKI